MSRTMSWTPGENPLPIVKNNERAEETRELREMMQILHSTPSYSERDEWSNSSDRWDRRGF